MRYFQPSEAITSCRCEAENSRHTFLSSWALCRSASISVDATCLVSTFSQSRRSHMSRRRSRRKKSAPASRCCAMSGVSSPGRRSPVYTKWSSAQNTSGSTSVSGSGLSPLRRNIAPKTSDRAARMSLCARMGSCCSPTVKVTSQSSSFVSSCPRSVPRRGGGTLTVGSSTGVMVSVTTTLTSHLITTVSFMSSPLFCRSARLMKRGLPRRKFMLSNLQGPRCTERPMERSSPRPL
mmetsp:Transcript_509/g.1509  ORF Transcript_509/g.1509 Transcript_509/m.1509 type:complete len:236 (+) Transcript_509:257-964(+)